MIKNAFIIKDNVDEESEPKTVLLNEDQLAMLGWLNKVWGYKFSCTKIALATDVTPEKYMLDVKMP